CFRAGSCQLTPEWCTARCSYLGFNPVGAGCQVKDDGHVYCCCGAPNPSQSTYVNPSING
uniref:Uncharacterized protein n=1 Tax=Oryza brachyantha TaxID=4533 RepID=J3N6J3_ORYBR